MNKNHGFVLGQDNIGPSGQFFSVEPKPIPHSVQH
jgi:hypothetical protein